MADSNHITPRDAEDEIDEYELYYGKYAVKEYCDEKSAKPGPLSRRPLFTSTYPFFAVSILFVLFTAMFNNVYLSDYLWASRFTVFTRHEYWRIFSAIFAHKDVIHLLSNLPLFFFFSVFLYEYFGFLVFPVIPLITGACTNLFTLYFYPETVRLIGASGMVYGMVSLWLVLYIYNDTDHTIPVRIFRSTGFAIILLFPTAYNQETSYLAHASGFFIGIMFALIILPFAKVKIRMPRNGHPFQS